MIVRPYVVSWCPETPTELRAFSAYSSWQVVGDADGGSMLLLAPTEVGKMADRIWVPACRVLPVVGLCPSSRDDNSVSLGTIPATG